MTQQEKILEHPFNNCGVAPFKLVGHAERLYYPCKDIDGSPNMSVPPMAGGMCAHCGTGIRDAYIIEDSNGKQFDVGCDCVLKVSHDPKLVDQVKIKKREIDKQKRHKREQKQLQELNNQFENIKPELEKQQHPNAYFAKQGKTKLDYYEYILNGCGVSGKIRNLKKIIQQNA